MSEEKIVDRYQRAVRAGQNAERIYKKYAVINQNDPDYDVYISGTAQSFQLAYETFWKYLKFYMEDQGIQDTPGSPRAVFSLALQNMIITDLEAKLLGESVKDRNSAIHIYEQENAEQILQDVPEYCTLFLNILKRLLPDR